MNKRYGLSKEEASSRFFIVDKDGQNIVDVLKCFDKVKFVGLISKHRPSLAKMEEEFYDLSSFAVDDAELEGKSLLETVKLVKPNIIIGLSACGGLFSEEVLQAMNESDTPPIIFPLSNPTSRSECTATQAQAATGGRAIFASGSPFPDIEIGKEVIASSQCNNRYYRHNSFIPNRFIIHSVNYFMFTFLLFLQ